MEKLSLSRDLKIGIIGGLISSILMVIFIQPIMIFIWNFVLSIGNSIQAGYVDRIYRSAALGDRNIVGHATLMLVLLAFTILPTFVLSPPGVFRRIAPRPGPTWMGLFMVIICMILSVSLAVAVSLSTGVMEITASFNQRLTIIDPSISDQEHKGWKAKWAKMRGQNDYHELVIEMEKRALDLKIELPPLREP